MIRNLLYFFLICLSLTGWCCLCGAMLAFIFDFLHIFSIPEALKMLSALRRFKQEEPEVFAEVTARLAEDELSKDGEIKTARIIGDLVNIDHEKIRKSWLYRKMVCFVLRFENSPDYAYTRIIGQEQKSFRLPCHTVLPVFSNPDADGSAMLRFTGNPDCGEKPFPESILDEITAIFFVKQIELERKDEVNHEKF